MEAKHITLEHEINMMECLNYLLKKIFQQKPEEKKKNETFSKNTPKLIQVRQWVWGAHAAPGRATAAGRQQDPPQHHHDGALAAAEDNEAFPDHERRGHDHGEV